MRCARRDRVAEPDIHLEPNLGGRHTGDDFDADAAVLLFLSNEPHSEGVEVELHAIVGDLEPQDLLKRRTNGCNARLAEPEQVEVSRCRCGWPVRAVKRAAPFSTKRDAWCDDASRKSSRSFA